MAEQQTPTTSTATDKTQLPRQLRPFTGNTVKVLLDWLHSFDKQTDEYNWSEEKKKDHILALMDEKNAIKMSNQLGTSDREEGTNDRSNGRLDNTGTGNNGIGQTTMETE